MAHVQQQPDCRAGAPQRLSVAIAGFLPMIAVMWMFPVVPSNIDHLGDSATAGRKVPWIVTALGLALAHRTLFAGALIARFGRRALVAWSTLLYAVAGTVPTSAP